MIRDLRWTSLAETLSRVASFATIPLITNSLIPARYGVYKGIFLFITIALVIQDISGVKYTAQKYVPEASDTETRSVVSAAVLSTILILTVATLLSGAAISVELVTILSTDVQEFAENHLVLLSLLLVTNPLSRVGYILQQSVDLFKSYSGVKAVREGLFLVAILALYYMGELTLSAALSSYLAANTVSIVLSGIVLSEYLLSKPDFSLFIEKLVEISLPLAPRAIMKKITENGPDAIILAAFSTSIYGKWAIIFIFVTVFTTLSQPFSKLFLPKLSQRLADDKPLDPIVLKYYRTIGILVAPAVIGGWIMGPKLILQIFGQEYLYSTAVVGVLLTAFGLQVMNTPSGYFFIATNNSAYETYNRLLGGTVKLTLTLLGAFLYQSLLLIAFGFLLEQVAIATVSLTYQSNWIDIPVPTPTQLLKLGAALSLMTSLVVALTSVYSSAGYSVVVIFLAAITYFAVLTLTGFFTEDDFNMVKKFAGV